MGGAWSPVLMTLMPALQPSPWLGRSRVRASLFCSHHLRADQGQASCPCLMPLGWLICSHTPGSVLLCYPGEDGASSAWCLRQKFTPWISAWTLVVTHTQTSPQPHSQQQHELNNVPWPQVVAQATQISMSLITSMTLRHPIGSLVATQTMDIYLAFGGNSGHRL